MKKDTKILIAVLSVVLVIVVAITGVCIWFFSPGIHVIGPFAHLDAEKKCYYIDRNTGEILGESILTVNCDINALFETFSGSISLPEYPVKGEIPPNPGSLMDEGYIVLFYTGITWVSEETGEVDPTADMGYKLYVKDAEHLFGVADFENGGVLFVCAENEQQAKELSRTAFCLYWGMEPQNW